MKAVRFLPAAALAACIVFTACSDYVGKEATHPLYAKYTTAKSAKSYREAADSLEEFLTICPKSPKAHYDVALIYKENLENYPAAIYHLLKYLELSGETISKEDQAAIRSYIQTCEQRMFEAYRVRNDIKLADDVPQADPAKLAAKNSEILALRETLQKYVDTDKALRAQNEELRKRLETAVSSASTVRPAAQTSASGTSASTTAATTSARSGGIPSSTTGTPGTTFAGENGVRYYYVGKGEGLQVIAQKMYGKVSMWKTIQEANNLPDNATLKLGQRLIIPPKQ